MGRGFAALVVAAIFAGSPPAAGDAGGPLAPGDAFTSRLDAGPPDDRAVRHRLVDAAGPLVIDAEAYDFDVYLRLLRIGVDDRAETLLEDDDGGIATNARLRFVAELGARYEIEVRPMIDDWGGEYVLRVRREVEPPDRVDSPDDELAYWLELRRRALAEHPALAARVAFAENDAEEPVPDEGAIPWNSLAPVADLERLARADDGLGHLALDAEEWTEAETLLAEALAIREAIRPDHPRLIDNVTGYGRALLWGGKSLDAIPVLDRAFELSRAEYGPDDAYTAVRADDLGEAWLRSKRPDVAIPHYENAVRILEKVHGPFSSELTLGIYRLATAYRDGERCDDAVPWIRRATAIVEAGHFAPSPWLAGLHGLAAELHERIGECEEVARHLRRRVDVHEALYGLRSRKSLSSLTLLGSHLAGALRLEEARSVFERALDVALRHDGENSPNAATCRSNLATVLRGLGLYDEALVLLAGAREFHARPGGKETDLARVDHAIGRTYLEMREYEAALPHLESALHTWEAIDGSESRRVGRSHWRIAEALRGLGRKAEARAEKKLAKDILKRHPFRCSPCDVAED